MDEQQIADLIRKYNDDTLERDERLALDMWYLKFAAESESKLDQEREANMVSRLKSALPLAPKPRKVKLWPRIAIAAAALILVVSVGVIFFNSSPMKHYANDIAPGKMGATLTLANGKKIYITDADTGQLANESGVRIYKSADGQIIYEVKDTGVQGTGLNTLQTSNGQQALVKLPDGSLVQLNAASALKYPFSFAGQSQRLVELSGEGFFEVHKDAAHPFLVKSRQQQVEVLGTAFNISAYPVDEVMKTTLVEGSVKLSSEQSETKVLVPGQQAIVGKASIAVENVEVEYALAWQKGYFMFNNENLEQIMETLARWYNIQPVFDDPSLKKKEFFGSISKFENISKILHVMELTNVASFDIRGNQVIISKK